MPFDRQGVGFAIARISIGLFFIGEGFNKLRWFGDSSILGAIFSRWIDSVGPGSIAHWYLEHIGIPGTSIFARLVPLGEISSGLALLVGFHTPVFASIAFFLVLNYNLANGSFVRPGALMDSSILPVLGPTLALAIGGAHLPWSVWAPTRRDATPAAIGL